MPFDTQETLDELFANLAASLKAKKGRGRKTVNTVYNTDFKVDSWKFNEWDYKGSLDTNLLPINARGLFTANNKIVVRGYDKFFNVSEVPITKEEYVIGNTEGPYDVTLKENGCIILVAGLSTGDLVVCSKHTTGVRPDITQTHAMVGDAAVRKMLAQHGKSASDLAKYLYENNLTAVAELCDDDFEEHVLPYTKESAGLYVHGLNYNTVKFQTAPVAQVEEFAKTWGFLCVESFRQEDPRKLFEFFHKAKETGTYKGREVEGFVVRCKHKGEDFFFKYKFDEPYLLYRQFREITRTYLRDGDIMRIKLTRNRGICMRYLQFAIAYFKDHPEKKEEYLSGHGIIRLRQLFLESIGESQGINLLRMKEFEMDALSGEVAKLALKPKKYVLVPVATISCGKTTTFQVLSRLLGWKHIQNDDISRKSKQKLVDHCVQALLKDDVVMADRNNCRVRERAQLFEQFAQKSEILDCELVFVALDFVGDLSKDEVWNITLDRTKKRGDKHQSIRYDSDQETAVGVMKMFLADYQKINVAKQPDSGFDKVIRLDIRGDNASLKNAKTILRELDEYGVVPKKFTEKEYQKAFKEALAYAPTYVKDMGRKPQYYGINVDASALRKYLDSTGHPQWAKMVKENRDQKEFHITLGHQASAKGPNKAKWKNLCKALGTGVGTGKKVMLDVYADIEMGDVVVAHDRLICVRAEIRRVYTDRGDVAVEPLNVHLHATVGTFGKVRPVESNEVLKEGGGERLGGKMELAKERVFVFF